jgi:tetratricopeptide (TPR) repeat protein
MSDGDEAPGSTLRGVVQQGIALHRAGRWQDAADVFDEALVRLTGHGGAAEVAFKQVLCLKLGCLLEQGDAAGVLAGAEIVLANDSECSDPRLDGFVADTLWLKSRAYGQLGERERERAVLREIIVRYRDEIPPRSQLARALFNEGVYSHDAGDTDTAIALWDELFFRFIPHPPSSDPFIPIRGQLAKSQVLARSGQLDAALLTCKRMHAECQRLDLGSDKLAEVRRTEHQCAALAQRSSRRGRLPKLSRRR